MFKTVLQSFSWQVADLSALGRAGCVGKMGALAAAAQRCESGDR